MAENIEARTVNKEQLIQVLEAPPSRAFVRPEMDVDLLMQGWSHMGLFTFQEVLPERRTSDLIHEQPFGWNPRNEIVDFLAGLYREELYHEGFSSPTELVLVGYGSNMKKCGLMRRVLYGDAESVEQVDKPIPSALPPTLGEFLNNYLESKRLGQNQFARLAGVSPSVVSNAITGQQRIRGSFLKIVSSLDLDEETRDQVLKAYAHPKILVRDYKGYTLASPRTWVDDIYDFSKDSLTTYDFGGLEELLLTRFINTSRRLAWIISQADRLSPEAPRKTLVGQLGVQSFFPSSDEMNRKNNTVPLLLHAWAARGLFSVPERAE